MANCWRSTVSKISEKVFDSLITGDETWVHFYEPKQKVDNKIWALKHAKRPSIAKWTLTAKKVLYTVFFRHANCCSKGRGVSSSFYKNVLWKHCEQIWEKSVQTCCQHVQLLCDNAPAHKFSTVAVFEVWKGQCIHTLPTAQTWPSAIFCSFRN